MKLHQQVFLAGIITSVSILTAVLVIRFTLSQCDLYWKIATLFITFYSLIAPKLNEKSDNPFTPFIMVVLSFSLFLDSFIYIWLISGCTLQQTQFQWKYVFFVLTVSIINNLMVARKE